MWLFVGGVHGGGSMRVRAQQLVLVGVLVLLGGIFITRIGQGDGGGAGATLPDTGGAEVGWARFEPDNGAVHVKVRAYGLAPGFHGFHVPAAGACLPPFPSAGGPPNTP